MTLPTKNSRKITVEGEEYRWLTSKNNGVIHLLVESAEISGQLLKVLYEPHDYYKRDAEHAWKKSFQAVSVTPKLVRASILLGLANGWQPKSAQKKVCELYQWQTEKLLPELPAAGDGQIPLKDIADEVLEGLQFDVSLDPYWRKKLFESEVGVKHELPHDYIKNRKLDEKYDLKFNVFNAGWLENGFAIFGIESVQFPDLTRYSTNNSAIL